MNDEQINTIIRSLENTDWNSIANDNDINSTYDHFITKLWDTINEYAPEKNVTINKNNIIRQPWMTSGLLQSINTRHKLFIKAFGNLAIAQYQSYIKYRNVLNSLKRTTKQSYYGNLLTEYKYDIRKTWKILNTIIGGTNDKTSILDNCIINGSSSTDQNNIADGFCNYF